MIIPEKISTLLKTRYYISIATADKKCEPHAAPKILFKIEGEDFYLADHAIARTVDNLRVNPRASLSFMDIENLEGYRLSGAVELIEKGPAFEKFLKEFEKKLIQISADRVIEGMKTGKRHKHFELEIPNRVIFIKIKIEEIVRIGSQGDLFSEKP